jgi:CBS-domain-containing membrane protein
MNLIRGFVAFWYDFIVGDDWLLAVGVLLTLALTAAAVRAELEPLAWLVLPLGAVAVLTLSLARTSRSS